MNKEYIIYVGSVFQLEWYFDENGESEALEYFNQLPEQQQLKFLFLVKRIGDFGKISNKEQFRNEGDKIYAFKPQPDRFLCFFFTGKKIIVTNAFQKKNTKTTQQSKRESYKIYECFYSTS